MPYVDRTCYDADSHIMELQDWLAPYADPAIRDRIRPLYLGGAGKLAERAVDEADRRRDDPEAARTLEGSVMGPKGWSALGAFDPRERSRASTCWASTSSWSSALSPRPSSWATTRSCSGAGPAR